MAARGKPNELRLTRVYDAPARLVWDAWTIPDQVAKWWGPRGFTITTHAKELRVGGQWRYTMHGPDGVDWPNLTTYYVVEPYKKLVYDHGASDDRPALFRVTVTFEEHDGKTTMDMTMALATPEAAAETRKHVKKAGGEATWDRLAEYLEERTSGKRSFVINRSFEAPIARVFEMWTKPEHLAKWLPPAGTKLSFVRSEIAVGKSALFVIAGEAGSMRVRAEYLAIEAPNASNAQGARIVYAQQFVDEREQAVLAPGEESWPSTLLNTIVFTEEAPGCTRVTLTTETRGEVTSAELAAFVNERSGMTLGWAGSFDVLETLL